MKSWTKGDRVAQATYGNGKVFSSKLVTLQPTNEPAPKKAPRKRAVKKKVDAKN